jgi:hypothetical protein
MQPASLLVVILLLIVWAACKPASPRTAIIEDATPTPIHPDRYKTSPAADVPDSNQA